MHSFVSFLHFSKCQEDLAVLVVVVFQDHQRLLRDILKGLLGSISFGVGVSAKYQILSNFIVRGKENV